MGIESEPYNSAGSPHLLGLNKPLNSPIWPTGSHTFCRSTEGPFRPQEGSIKLNLVNCLQLDEAVQITGIRRFLCVHVCLKMFHQQMMVLYNLTAGGNFEKKLGTQCTLEKEADKIKTK